MEKELQQEIESTVNLIDEVTALYPKMHVSFPLDYIKPDEFVFDMNSYEKRFSNILQSRGLVVFREPIIEGLNHIPDFFVYNRNCFKGKLVEITLYDRECSNLNASRKSRERKKRQIAELEGCGIPFVVIFRENMKLIRRYCDCQLF